MKGKQEAFLKRTGCCPAGKNGKKVSFASLDQRLRNGSNLPFSHNKQNRSGNGAGIEQIA